jgi:Restriction endonuclease
VDEPAGRGRDLEERVARYLATEGYVTARNVLVPGRSGAAHEVDVLAEKDDGLTTFKVAVECKSWARPVEKDVVSKLAYVLDDAGLNKGIVVCPAGARSGALLAALQLGVDVWDGDELARRTGPSVPSTPSGSVSRRAVGLIGQPDRRRAEALIRREARGLIRRETLVWSGPAWLPAYELQVTITRMDSDRRPQRVTTRSWNLHEALSGTLLDNSSSPVGAEPVALGAAVVDPLLQEQSVARELLRTVDRYLNVATAAASERHARRLAALGVDPPVESVEVEAVRPVFFGAHLGLLRRSGAERLTAIVFDGRLSPALDGAITANIRHVLAGAKAPDALVAPWFDVG